LDDHDFTSRVLNKYPHIKLVRLSKQTQGAAETIREGLQNIGYKSLHNKTLLLDCDTIYTNDIVSTFRNASFSTVFYTVKSPSELPLYSYISIDASYSILDIAEKTKISNNANTGAYGFANVEKLLYYCKNNKFTFNNEPYMSCVIKTMLSDSEPFYGYELSPHNVFSVGTPDELNKYLESTYAYLFDLDGTLVVTDEIYFEVWHHILNVYDGELTQELFKKYIQGNSDKYVLQMLLPNVVFKDGEISALKDDLFMQHLHKIKPVKGAVDYLRTVKLAGNPCCIVTNCNRSVAEAIVSYLGITEFVEFIISSESCTNHKPSPDPYHMALNKLGIDSSRAFIFEDSKTGILSARSVQPKCLVGVSTCYSSEELIAYGVDIPIVDFSENISDKLLNNTGMFEDQLKRFIARDYGKVDIDTKKLKGGFIADVLQLRLNNTECVLKIESKGLNSLSQMATQLQLYDREYYFYDTVSKYMKDVRIPRFIGLVKDDNFKTIGMILENLYVTGKLVPNLNLNTASIDTSLKIIDKMACLHAQFWNKSLDIGFPLLKSATSSCFYPFCNHYIHEKWPIFLNKWNKVLTHNQIMVGENIKNTFTEIQLRMTKSNTTFIHGDIKSPNIFYDTDNGFEPVFLDWQHCSIGKGVQDLAFFIIESFEINNIDNVLPLFKSYYYCKLGEYGVKNYSQCDFDKDLYDAFCYVPFFTAVWFGSMSEDELIDKNFPFFFIQKLFKIFETINI
jgi:HAD superfamily hydrolase (TIGR01509 family)